MAKLLVVVGFADEDAEVAGVSREVITERTYIGEEVRGSRQLREGENLYDDISTSTELSIIADGYIVENIANVRYAFWIGTRWKVAEVTRRRPRLRLRLGEVYHGAIPVPDTP